MTVDPQQRPERPVRGSALSRADALRAYFELPEEQLAGVAQKLGFEWLGLEEPKTEEEPDQGKRVGAQPKVDSADRPLPKSAPARPIHHWRPIRVDHHDPDPEKPSEGAVTEAPQFVERDVRSTAPPPPGPPIVPKARLRRRLDDELRTRRRGRDLDVPRLVDRMARGETLHRLPRRLGIGHARLVLILDLDPRLMPFWDDQIAVAVDLVRRLGEERVRYLLPPENGTPEAFPSFDPDEIVLAVSDLGFYGGPGVQTRWLRLGRRLRGAGAKLRALVPCPAWRWTRDLEQLWRPVDWSAPEGRGQRLAPDPEGPSPVDALLALLAPAVRVEPGLLRSVRGILGALADLGTEAEIWNHPQVDGASSRSLAIDEDARRSLLAGLERRLRGKDAETWRSWVDAVALEVLEFHKDWGDVVWATELMHFRALGVSDRILGEKRVEKAVEVLDRAQAHAAAGGDGPPTPLAQAARAFWKRELVRSPRGASDDGHFGKFLVNAYRTLRKLDPTVPPPAGVTPEMIEGSGTDHPRRRWTVWQLGGQLFIHPADGSEKPRGSRLVDFWAQEPRVVVSRPGQKNIEIDLETAPCEVPCSSVAERLELVTDLQRVTLERWIRPDWATRAGRDPYGLWASFEIEGIEQRMRWIPPGRFLMGSPESEEGRDPDEGPQHEVELTEGYWLAETPCIQPLWESVMGENPSRFQSPRRPVERVSWDDCQRFLDRLNFRVRDLELRLPTEAEWERACRAGTQTATWLGDLDIQGESNAQLLGEIAWYGGNSGVDYDLDEAEDSSDWPEKQFEHTRAGTRDVVLKGANPWGLFDILGNVLEWSEDSWDYSSNYPSSLRFDPLVTEGSLRVFRGGSWDSFARYVRAAYRGGAQPGLRDDDLGFRLSRGPQVRGAQDPEGSRAVSEAAQRGTSGRARSRRARSWVDRLEWAADGGLDSYGRWVAIEVEGVVHRLRWIYPGTFRMGSPEGEDGRWDDEGPVHDVTLTQGFWLGETQCIQDLWQAVMGSNPSEFKSPRRPVEKVSWKDCYEFFGQLAKKMPGFEARLPTEAQWEYACRAGTQTATWRGDFRIRGERDAPHLDPIAWYGGNSGVDFDLAKGWDSSDWEEKQYPHTTAGTREVGLKPANPWGLYDMLGNVREWCRDQWDLKAGYPGGSRIDPLSTEGSSRVSRGGSWHSSARGVRAACRIGFRPGDRSHDLGFRLSRGPEEEWLAEPKQRSEGEPGSADRGTREKRDPGEGGAVKEEGS